MAATQQALLMASDNAVTVPEACEADPYYSCGPTNDPYWANVVLSMHFDGDLVDEKGHAFSADGTTFTSSGKFADAVDIGGTAVTGGGSNVVYLVTATTDFWLDGGDFTIEGWVKNNATNNNRPRYLCRLARESDNSDYLQIFINESGDVWSFSYPTALSTTTGISSAIPCSIGTYQHVALTRQGSTYRLFVDGIQASTATNTYLRPSAATTVHVGNSRRSFVDALCGEIDDLRITKGIARYTGNFNIPTAAFPDALETVWDPADPRTVLSLHADDVTVEDASCYQPKTVTLSGTLGNIAEVTDAESKFGGKSFSVPNSGSSTTAGIIVTDHQDLDFGTGDFTIEMWAYRTANTYYGTLFYGTYGGEFSLIVAPTTGLVVLNYRSSGGAQANIATGVVFPLTTWQHVVVQRRGTNFEFYLNGVLGNTTAITGGASSTVNSTGDFYLGRTNASSALTWAGYIDEVRITKGVARIANPNLPTAAFPDSAPDDPYWANVVLMLHFESAMADSSTSAMSFSKVGGDNNGPAVGGKFGTGQYSVVDNTAYHLATGFGSALTFDSGDFTVECWVRYNGGTIGTTGDFAGAYSSAAFSLALSGAYKLGGNFIIGGTSYNGAVSTGINDNLWHHYAVVRSGGALYRFLDGVLEHTATFADSATMAVPTNFYIGRNTTSNYAILDVDDLRITKGVARYPTSFTPPAQPNCDSVVPGNIVAIPGTSPLTGMSVAVQQQTIGDQNGAVALSGVSATVNAGGLFSDSVTSSKTVALTGRSVTVSRGTLAVPAYPNLISVSTTTIEAVATGNTAKLTFTFFTDGTYTVVDQALTTRTSGTWIDTAQTNYSIPAISNQYRVVAINIFAGTSYTYSTLPFTLGTSFSVVIQNLASSTLNIFDFQLTISPTSTNPRYAEPYYYGTHRFKAVLSNDMS